VSKIVDLGTTRAFTFGTSLTARLPESWMADNKLHLGSKLYVQAHLNGMLEYRLTPSEWSRECVVREKPRKKPIITVPADMARTHGIKPGDDVRLRTELSTGTMWMWREDAD
jgi:uncharacterized membrane protein (UPF0127 family)